MSRTKRIPNCHASSRLGLFVPELIRVWTHGCSRICIAGMESYHFDVSDNRAEIGEENELEERLLASERFLYQTFSYLLRG